MSAITMFLLTALVVGLTLLMLLHQKEWWILIPLGVGLIGVNVITTLNTLERQGQEWRGDRRAFR